MASADLEKLKGYLAKRQAGDVNATRPISAADLANAGETEGQRKTREHAEREVSRANAAKQREQRQQDQDRQQAQQDQQQRERAQISAAQRVAGAAGERKPLFAGWGEGAQRLASSIPTPGDVAFPLMILLVFWLIIVPINGKTRAMWFWEVLIGQAKIPPASFAPGSGTSATGTSPGTIITNSLPTGYLTPPSAGATLTTATFSGYGDEAA